MTTAPFDVPVLFLVFNRPELARQVFARIRAARPTRLFVAADGPRPNRPDDEAACRECRRLAEQVDWPCAVRTLFRETNLGCRAAVSSAITWFFEQVEAGIVLEDDCLPDPSFFPFCAELLERYRDDERVTTISGMGYRRPGLCGRDSYAFTTYQLIWGWATWRRAWRRYEPTLERWPYLSDPAWLRRHLGNARAACIWSQLVAAYRRQQVDTWDYPWNFSCWAHGGLGIVPAVNLVDNIGFGPGGTHTTEGDSQLAPATALPFPLRHPRRVKCNRRLDREYERLYLPAERPRPGWRAALVRRWRNARCFAKRGAEILAWALRARQAFARARRLDLPGQDYYHLGRRIGWRLLAARVSMGPQLLACPVSSTRYFEFDFARRALAQDGFAPRRCLDVSSPFLFSFDVARRRPGIQVRMLNPDPRDWRLTRQMAAILKWPGIAPVGVGVEALDDEPPATWDAVWSLSVIEHVAGAAGDDRDAVRRMWQAVRPGGRLILTVPTDRRSWDEFRESDEYGTQAAAGASRRCFFQRFYDEQAIAERIVRTIGIAPARQEWFGEKANGHFHAYVARWRRAGMAATRDDPLDVAANYQIYPSFAAMPGAGVCGLLFLKPETAGAEARVLGKPT